MIGVAIVRTWSARYKAAQIQVCEDRVHQNWIAANDLRKVLPTLRTDLQLQQYHDSGFEKLDQSGRYFFNERSLAKELKRMGSHDALMFLAWLDKTIVYPATRKREGTPALRSMPMPLDGANGEANTQPASLSGSHIPSRNDPPAARPVLGRHHRRESARHGFRAEHLLAPFGRLLGGELSLRRTLLAGCAALMGLTGLLLLFCLWLANPSAYVGNYILRQWLVVLALLAWCIGFVLWCVAVMRCALRRQSEGRSSLVSGLAFVGSAVLLLGTTNLVLPLAGEWATGWWGTVTRSNQPVQVLHDARLGRIVVRGQLGFGSYQALAQAVATTPRLRLVEVESPGGYVIEGMAMARLIEQHGLDTVSFAHCASACTLLLAGGQDRYLGPNAVVGFHRSGLQGVAASHYWNPTDHQIADYYRARNTAEPFVLRALDTPYGDIWTPPHSQMYEAGFATLRWSERKAGY